MLLLLRDMTYSYIEIGDSCTFLVHSVCLRLFWLFFSLIIDTFVAFFSRSRISLCWPSDVWWLFALGVFRRLWCSIFLSFRLLVFHLVRLLSLLSLLSHFSLLIHFSFLRLLWGTRLRFLHTQVLRLSSNNVIGLLLTFNLVNLTSLISCCNFDSLVAFVHLALGRSFQHRLVLDWTHLLDLFGGLHSFVWNSLVLIDYWSSTFLRCLLALLRVKTPSFLLWVCVVCFDSSWVLWVTIAHTQKGLSFLFLWYWHGSKLATLPSELVFNSMRVSQLHLNLELSRCLGLGLELYTLTNLSSDCSQSHNEWSAYYHFYFLYNYHRRLNYSVV